MDNLEHKFSSLVENTTSSPPDLPSRDPPGYLYIVTSVIIVLGIVCVSTNLLTLVIVYKRPVLRYRSRKLLISLAVADVLVGGAALIMAGRFILGPCDSLSVDKVLTVPMTIPLQVSMAHMVLIAGDRFLAIVFPLRYESLVTGRRVRVAVGAVWIGDTLMSVTFTFLTNYSASFFGCGYEQTIPRELFVFIMLVFLAILSILICIYSKIWWVARKHRLRIPQQANQVGAIADSQSSFRQRPGKATKIITGILAAFLITSLPINLLGWLHILNLVEKQLRSTFYRMLLVSCCFLVLKSCSNFFIYAARNKQFYNAYKSLLRCESNTATDSVAGSNSNMRM